MERIQVLSDKFDLLREMTANHLSNLSNAAPNSDEKSYRKTQRHLKRRHELVVEIAALIEKERVHSKFDMASFHNSHQRIMRIPDEILSSIMEFASSRSDDPSFDLLPSNTHYLKDPRPRLVPSRSFISLNLLCRQARRVALMSPHCWKDVLVVLSEGEVMNPSRMLKDQLSRSRSVPFNLHLYVTFPGLYSDDEEILAPEDRRTLDLLTPHVHRCQHLAFYRPWEEDYADESHPSRRFFPSLSWNLPSLRHLTIMDDMFYPTTFQLNLAHIWPTESQCDISCVEILFNRPDGIEEDLMVPFGKLLAPRGVRHLRLQDGFSYTSMINFLRQAPQLEHFDWDLGYGRTRIET